MYIHDTTKEQKTYQQLQADYPNTSLPVNGTNIIAEVWYYIHPTTQPEYDEWTQKLEEGEPLKTADEYNQVWNIVQLTQQEMDDLNAQKELNQNDDMLQQGREATIGDDARISTGSTPIIEDRSAHDTWMQGVYNNYDNGITTIPKPPSAERQAYTIFNEDDDPYTFTRYQDQWGWRWRMDLQRDSVNALAVAIYDSLGNYLYTTGGLIRNEADDGWYTECPAGQADATPEDVYFKWLLGSADISGLEVYPGTEDTMTGHVKSDTEYDI